MFHNLISQVCMENMENLCSEGTGKGDQREEVLNLPDEDDT